VEQSHEELCEIFQLPLMHKAMEMQQYEQLQRMQIDDVISTRQLTQFTNLPPASFINSQLVHLTQLGHDACAMQRLSL
jgi:FAD synthase